MFSVGLTGGIGSGKSLAADLFAKLGAAIVDSDLIAHSITAPGGAAMPAIVERFGPQALTPQGAMDRAVMRRLVFSDRTALADLEAITHPLIQQASMAQAVAHLEAGAPYLIFVVPLLVESWRRKKHVDRVLVVDCPTETQIERVVHRSGLTREETLAIMAKQASREERLAQADDVVDNSASPDTLALQVKELHARYLDLAGC
ncbi:MAG: dephospho-CoA kinase [Candidatus Protistobacter heckmanni]|nr:dephospho-CoA kinase [Candidatus Protistobacter heckmanni]